MELFDYTCTECGEDFQTTEELDTENPDMPVLCDKCEDELYEDDDDCGEDEEDEDEDDEDLEVETDDEEEEE